MEKININVFADQKPNQPSKPSAPPPKPQPSRNVPPSPSGPVYIPGKGVPRVPTPKK